jgi:signal transduction histidine kinase
LFPDYDDAHSTLSRKTPFERENVVSKLRRDKGGKRLNAHLEKAAGQGTGPGLSLSYDIIVKAHGGKLTFETEENNYTEFIVSLPRDSQAQP